MELMGVELERVTVLYPGVEPRFQPVQDAGTLRRVRNRYRLPARFILGLSTLQPRKNFEGLIEAFGLLLAARGGELEIVDLDLVIGGGKGWMYEGLSSQVERLGLDERIHFVGFVDDDDLPALYSLACAFAFPTWYEGFGLPVLEAMACGTPVVAADNSSLPEVVGEAGLLVDAGDPEALCEALARLLTNRGLEAHLVLAGRRQARRFTWEGAARQLLDLYRSFAQV
jgi:glycosyltransferase involved in cell wall biosynthesis